MIKSDLNDLKNNIVNEDGWGSYFIYDNFLDDKMFLFRPNRIVLLSHKESYEDIHNFFHNLVF